VSNLDLYSSAAQVIPLFLGFLAFELRAFAADESVRGSGVRANVLTITTCVALTGILGLGEFTAIHVLARGTATPAARTAVSTALFAGGLLLTLGIVESSLRPLTGDSPTTPKIASNVLVVLGVALWLLFG
jgi:hypothetical protein